MSISTRKGDSGYTGTLAGERVPKFHIVTEAVGAIDEANAFLGLARASSKEKRTKRVMLQVQKQLFTVGAELSAHGKPVRKTVSETDVKWLERLIDYMEEALKLPPGFVAFGQEERSAHMDVARTAVRKAERIAVRMAGEGMIGNPSLLKYLNRLSDLIFVLACFEERNEAERQKIDRALFYSHWSDPYVCRLSLIVGSTILALVAIIVLLLLFHRPAP